MAAPACLTARPAPSLWGHRGCHENPWEKCSEGGSHLARDTGYRRKTHERRLLPSPVCHTPEPNRPPSKSVAASFFFLTAQKKKRQRHFSRGRTDAFWSPARPSAFVPWFMPALPQGRGGMGHSDLDCGEDSRFLGKFD